MILIIVAWFWALVSGIFIGMLLGSYIIDKENERK